MNTQSSKYIIGYVQVMKDEDLNIEYISKNFKRIAGGVEFFDLIHNKKLAKIAWYSGNYINGLIEEPIELVLTNEIILAIVYLMRLTKGSIQQDLIIVFEYERIYMNEHINASAYVEQV